MAEKHDRLVAQYRAHLLRRGYKIELRSPFVDYRPDIFASRGSSKLFVEAEIESTLHTNHTLDQLVTMHTYVCRNGRHTGVLLVPRSAVRLARFLLDTVFGDGKIRVESR
jgi:hypothetical protein